MSSLSVLHEITNHIKKNDTSSNSFAFFAGRMVFKDSQISKRVISDRLAPLRFVDDSGQPTVDYPFNPNGTEDGIAALCSDNGRHLAMMPHPERCVLPWQWPWMPLSWHEKLRSRSPWLTIFANAYKWCQTEQS